MPQKAGSSRYHALTDDLAMHILLALPFAPHECFEIGQPARIPVRTRYLLAPSAPAQHAPVHPLRISGSWIQHGPNSRRNAGLEVEQNVVASEVQCPDPCHERLQFSAECEEVFPTESLAMLYQETRTALTFAHLA